MFILFTSFIHWLQGVIVAVDGHLGWFRLKLFKGCRPVPPTPQSFYGGRLKVGMWWFMVKLYGSCGCSAFFSRHASFWPSSVWRRTFRGEKDVQKGSDLGQTPPKTTVQQKAISCAVTSSICLALKFVYWEDCGGLCQDSHVTVTEATVRNKRFPGTPFIFRKIPEREAFEFNMRNLHIMMWFICLYQKDITKVSKVAVAMDASVLSFTLNCPAVGLEFYW